MTVMAALSNARLYFGGDFCRGDKKNMAVARLGYYPSLNCAIKPKQPSLLVIASASTPPSIDTINGKKVHGINFGEAPFRSNKYSDSAKESCVDAPLHAVLLGRFVEDQFVYRQTFIIRSYEIGPDKTATMETLMNLLQVCELVAVSLKLFTDRMAGVLAFGSHHSRCLQIKSINQSKRDFLSSRISKLNYRNITH